MTISTALVHYRYRKNSISQSRSVKNKREGFIFGAAKSSGSEPLRVASKVVHTDAGVGCIGLPYTGISE